MLYVAAAVPWAGPCHADLAENDILDISDVLAFLVGFAAADPIADMTEPRGVHDICDVIQYMTFYGA